MWLVASDLLRLSALRGCGLVRQIAISKLNFILISGAGGGGGVMFATKPPPRYSDQRLTRDPAHSQLLIVTRRIWQIIILNNLLPWRPLTLTGHRRPRPRVQICGWEAGFLSFFFFWPLCPLKTLRIRDVHYHFNLPL